MNFLRCDNMIERMFYICCRGDSSLIRAKFLEQYTFLLVFLTIGAGGLRDVRVTVPEAVASGSTVTLNCRYDLETDTLYSVKWYKGRQEFFRYIPKELPHTRVFSLPGVDVDVGRSGPLTVVLRAVTPFLSGRYRCEVSADAPFFHTAMKTSYMHVVDVPNKAPDLVAERSRVAPGDTLRAHCTSPPARPTANITWLLNGQPINGTSLKSLPVDDELNKWPHKVHDDKNSVYIPNKTSNVEKLSDEAQSWNIEMNSSDDYARSENQETVDWKSQEFNSLDQSRNFIDVEVQQKKRSVSSLSLTVGPNTLRDGALRLTCKVSIYSLYNAQVELLLAVERPQIASVLVLATGHTHSSTYKMMPSSSAWIIVGVILTLGR